MTKEEARQALLFHSFAADKVPPESMEKGFLGMLRPFTGELIESNYQEVMQALKVLADDLSKPDQVDREIVSALWGICHLTRLWALEKDGMLQRNKLINEAQIKQLGDWVESISFATMMLLDGVNDEAYFEN